MTAISARVLGEATVQELRESIRGEVITPRDPGYTEASRIWSSTASPGSTSSAGAIELSQT